MSAPDAFAAIAGIVVLWLLFAGLWKSVELIPKIFRKISAILSSKGIELERPSFLRRKPKKSAAEKSAAKKKWAKTR